MARAGGPDAVVLREATRRVGVAPNAAYRHFADRDALLAAVCQMASRELAHRMETRIARVSALPGSPDEARARLAAIGYAYVEFATSEPGLFATAFAMPRHPEIAAADDTVGRAPRQLLNGVLDEMVTAGALPATRREGAEFVAWAGVHGLAMLINQGPLRGLDPVATERLLHQLVDTITRGL